MRNPFNRDELPGVGVIIPIPEALQEKFGTTTCDCPQAEQQHPWAIDISTDGVHKVWPGCEDHIQPQ